MVLTYIYNLRQNRMKTEDVNHQILTSKDVNSLCFR